MVLRIGGLTENQGTVASSQTFAVWARPHPYPFSKGEGQSRRTERRFPGNLRFIRRVTLSGLPRNKRGRGTG